MNQEVKSAKAIVLNYLLKEREEVSKDKHKASMRERDLDTFIKDLEAGLKIKEAEYVVVVNEEGE